MRIWLTRSFNFRFIEGRHKTFGINTARDEMLFKESPRLRSIGFIKGTGSSKSRCKRLETDTEAAAVIAIMFRIIGWTAKSRKGECLIVVIPARAIWKTDRSYDVRQIMHKPHPSLIKRAANSAFPAKVRSGFASDNAQGKKVRPWIVNSL